jgi:polysaccharide export outer membrane protein
MRLLFSTVIFAAAALAQQQQQPTRAATIPEQGANLPAQAVGPNDLIAVSVYDAPELSRTIRIGADGMIRLPMLKRLIKAEGLFPAELETAIAQALREEQILVDPFVTVTIAEYHSRPISVSGAVKMPLVFQAEGPVSLLDAIARAQGLSDNAGSEVLVSQTQPGPNGTTTLLTRRIAVRTLINEADPAVNIKLTGGEEIRVPEVAKIYVVGNVKKPGAYPVQGGSDTTVLQMLALSEGLDQFSNKNAFIYRREANGTKNEIPVQLDKILQRKSPDVPLIGDDILYIPDNRGKRIGVKAIEAIVAAATGAGAYGLMAGR